VDGHTDSTIVLAVTPKALRPGRWAIEWNGGYGEVGPIVARTGDRVTRRFRLAAGTLPGATARLAGFAFDADPGSWLGIEFQTVAVPTPAGPLPCWLVPGADSTWAVFVHGRGASRAELLRMLAGYRTLGLPCLLISYRGDPGAPPVAGGGYRMGAGEWLDLEDAVRFALAHGARDVVPVGCSMGGGIVAQFLRLSPLRSAARAAVLDATALDWNAVLAQGAAERHVAAPIAELGKWVARLRSGIRWDDLTQARHAAEFAAPMLIFHGGADHTVPIDVSERFAAARPDLVTLVRVEGADHVESANWDGARYEELLTAWLAARGIGSRLPEDHPAPRPARP
jgi:hypothetical protein